MNLPPYISRTPPPLNEIEEEDEDFGTFAACSELGEEACDTFGKTSHINKNEDNISEDSGFCMNSGGQTQSPCDASPLSSSYNKVNECTSIDNREDIDLTNSLKESEVYKEDDDKINECCNHSTFIESYVTLNFKECDLTKSVKPLDLNSSLQKKCDLSGNLNHNSEKVSLDLARGSFDFVEKNVVNDDDVLQSDNYDQDLGVVSIQPLDEKDIYELKNVEQSSFHSNFSLTEQSVKIDKNEFLKNEAPSIQPETTLNSGSLKTPVLTFLCSDENSIEVINSEPSSSKEYESVNAWNTEDDEFSDFAAFQLINKFSEKDLQCQTEKCETEDNFVRIITETLQSAINCNSIWNSLQFFEETPAFKYQWTTSSSQIKFLQALKIDSRNILSGPWNKMNKFIRADVSNLFDYNTSENPKINNSFTSRTSEQKEVIPSAHFDWNTSGLINPLKGTINEKEAMPNLKENYTSRILMSQSKDVLNSLPILYFFKSSNIIFK